MQPDAVVEANNVVSNIVCSVAAIGIVFLPNPLPLQIQEEAVYDGACFVIYPTATVAAQGADQAIFGQQRLMLDACVLRSTV